MMQKTRRTVLVQLNSLNLGGTQICALELACSLRAHGYDSVLIGPRDTLPVGPSLLDVARVRGVRVEAFDRPQTIRAGARLLSQRARACGADIVHVYGSDQARSAYWGPALFARRPLILTVYEMAVAQAEFTGPPLIVGTGYLIDALEGRAGATYLVSPPVDLDRDNVEAVDTADFLRLIGNPPESQVRVVLVSRLDEEMKAHGVETAIRAVERSRRADLLLIIVGTGDAETRLRALGRAVNLRLGREAIVFVGALVDPRPAYAGADVALGMGSSAARALAFGRRLIALGESGWSMTFTPETAGTLFRSSFWSEEHVPHAVDRLAQELDALVADDAARPALERFSREFSATHFGLTAMAGRLADVYASSRRNYRLWDWLRDLKVEGHTISRRARTVVRGGSAIPSVDMSRQSAMTSKQGTA